MAKTAAPDNPRHAMTAIMNNVVAMLAVLAAIVALYASFFTLP